jgi:hypothetical protein
MKIIELINGIRLPLNNEEADVLGRFAESTVVEGTEFNEREREVANHLVNKEVLLRRNQNGKIIYKKKD